MIGPIDAEQAIETMLLKGAAIMREAVEIYRPIAVFAAYSGGNDSVTTTHFACTNYSAEVFHGNTMTGLKLTREHVHKTCNRFGWRLHEKFATPQGPPSCMYTKGKRLPFDAAKSLPFGKWIDGGRTSYEESVLNFGFPGPAQHGLMFNRLKGRSVAKLIAQAKTGHHRRSHVLIVSGIRHDESSIRAGYKRAIQKDGSAIWVNPFYWQTKYDFELYRQEFGLPRNPVTDRIGISGECNCGCFAKPGERQLIASIDPDKSAEIDELQKRVNDIGFPWGWGERPPAWFTKKDDQPTLFDTKDFRPMCVGCERRSAG